MGNSKSQPCRRSRPMYLFYLIQRTWTGKTDPVDKEDQDQTADRESDLSLSRCSDCKSCHYRQDSLTFDSESEMAPNAEEELLSVKPWGPQPEKLHEEVCSRLTSCDNVKLSSELRHFDDERLRPPTYNAEDYAIALRRWGRRPVVMSHESHGTLPSTTSSSSGYASGCGEMTLRQFTSVSELLNKLRADLRLAFPSFVQEFASPPADGITLLLETLRGVQLIQNSPPNGQGGARISTRRAALDELGCVECLAACCERCPDTPRLLSQAQPGLLALAVCLTSSLNRSRVLALQLLTKVCQAPGGHLAVSEAVSTLRLRYGEGGRFRFLAGALLAPRAAIALRVAGVSFLNAFLKSAPRTQTRLYIQAEACEAGLEPRVLQSWLDEVDVRSDDSLTELLHKEVQKWSHNCVDVEALQKRLERAEETCTILGNKVSILQEQLDKCNKEKINGYVNSDDRKTKSKSSSLVNESRKMIQQGMSSNAEDEGISSSERSSSPEVMERTMRQIENENNKIGCIDNDQETTIDDVIEELRIIVKDAEEEFEDRNGKCVKNYNEATNESSLSKIEKNIGSTKISVKSAIHESMVLNERLMNTDSITYFGNEEDEEFSVDSAITRKLSSSCSDRLAKSCNDVSVKIIVKSPEFEDAIVPAILYPQPPRRAPPCLSTILAAREGDFLDNHVIYNNNHNDNHGNNNQDEEDMEEETLGDGSDSLLSASRVKYVTKNDNNDFPAVSTNLEASNFYQNDLNVPHSANLRNSLQANARQPGNRQREPKTIRNFDNPINSENLHDSDTTTKYLDVYDQFENTSKGNNDSSTSLEKRGSSKCKNDMEKKISLRRSASQDLLNSNLSSPDFGKSRIESRIRKFENLNAFENSRLDFSRHDVKSDFEKISSFDSARSRIKRSESFHHVSMTDTKVNSLKRSGGSESGLVYITDYDLEPLVNRKNVRDGFPKFVNLLTKSLDRIDESLDSITIDETILSAKRSQTTCLSKEKHGKISKTKTDDKSKNKCGGLKNATKKTHVDKNSKKNEKIGNHFCGNSTNLRNDEFYDDAARIGRQWNFQNDIDDYRKIYKFTGNVNTMTIGSNQSGHNEKIVNKFSPNDSAVFLPSGRYDAFGLGKNRFNAGKYSGQSSQNRDNDIGVRRNSTASLVAKRGKVTDIISGLY